MKIKLLENTTTSGAPNINKAVGTGEHDTITFSVYGVGTGTWSANVKISAVIDGMVIDSSPLSFTIDNTTSNKSTSLSTGCNSFVGWVESLSGTCSITAVGTF